MTLLQLQDVTYRYKNTAEAVLYQINYNFESGKFYSIIGESGAGKSTLLSLLAGLFIDQADIFQRRKIIYQVIILKDQGNMVHAMVGIPLLTNVLSLEKDRTFNRTI